MEKRGNNLQGDDSLRKTVVDQMAEQGMPIIPDSSSPTKNDQVEKELAEEATWPINGKQVANPTAKTESATRTEDNDYYSGMSQ